MRVRHAGRGAWLRGEMDVNLESLTLAHGFDRHQPDTAVGHCRVNRLLGLMSNVGIIMALSSLGEHFNTPNIAIEHNTLKFYSNPRETSMNFV